VLTAIAGRNAKIGFMLFEMRRAADRIGRALESGQPSIVAPEATSASDDTPTTESTSPSSLPSDLPDRDAAPTGPAAVDLPPPTGSTMFDRPEPQNGEADAGQTHHFFQPPRSAASE
jgi:hypothetical protein